MEPFKKLRTLISIAIKMKKKIFIELMSKNISIKIKYSIIII